ncbi:pentatricopeptide repeat-containing protein [Prunus yedoensis var. nudiflora]|uniref:Pentatricopeptide repeat-containing protein n=1 Tax=Prunus yedoensis var. nudiflora TaxID=2094558 RepID=A0A314Z666_PRUYE|nr:pentatricopeptide repeat-containing protein [Prunus yedoensis var. nudiflora]
MVVTLGGAKDSHFTCPLKSKAVPNFHPFRTMIVKHGLRRPYHALASAAASEIPSLPSTTTNNYPRYLNLLSSCRDLKSLLQIHAHLIVSGLQQDNSITDPSHKFLLFV